MNPHANDAPFDTILNLLVEKISLKSCVECMIIGYSNILYRIAKNSDGLKN